ncbi:(R)-stereoselective amidase [Polystyrenella longa]|uniref:(R)-stereoselective amidase n=1 Tax=Polystyrenella longa TaxID=2528007 RepID=A0A518CQ61_9PLAN|nr:carbon-nitrogen hydrolase family protein [Polystyrenella longa]QDU81362.1 (R)-stereoselective amidase [Polystyrenella longa]
MKIAGVQIDVQLGEVDQNLQMIIKSLEETTAAGAHLTLFPECALSGYCFESRDEAAPFAQSIPGPATDQLTEACRRLDCFTVIGLLELEGNDVYNSAVLIGPEGVIGKYRKVHLPYLGVDRYTTPGNDPYQVFNAGGLRVGMQICYDASFPEATRCLTMLGADLVVLPTNWPPGAETTADYCINSRAVENGIYFMAVNRCGRERGFQFIGRSSICDPFGKTLAKAETRDVEILYAEIDVERARNKRYQRVPGKHEIDRLADRRPEMYIALTQPHGLSTPHAELKGK